VVLYSVGINRQRDMAKGPAVVAERDTR
jgi:hypothetical protein